MKSLNEKRKYRARLAAIEEEKRKFGGSFLALPDLIVMDILARLPIETIVKSRCVCKTWRSLTFDSHFAKLYNARVREALVLQTLKDCAHVPRDFYMFEPSGCGAHMKFNTKTNIPTPHMELVGSCNGLLCFFNTFSRKSFFVCNPITGQYRITPKGPKRRRKNPFVKEIGMVSGFGYSPKTGQYKVLSITKKKIYQTNQTFSEGELYTLGTDTWRSIGNIPFSSRKKLNGVSLNGALHWIVDTNSGNSELIICALDIDSELIRPISPPPYIDHESGTGIVLGVLGGCLSICDNYKAEVEIWVMKNYMKESSWRKDFVINPNLLPPRVRDSILTPLMIREDGDILILCGSDAFASYNPTRMNFGKTLTTVDRVEAIVHLPSFVSLENMVELAREIV